MKISVIIPVYKASRYIRECLDSVVAQKYTDWECICVDDGSPDDSGVILDEYAAKEKRFVVVHQANQGVAIARNNGIALATGDYVGFVDGDDTISPDWLLCVSDAIHATGADMVKMSFRRDTAFTPYQKTNDYKVYCGRELCEWTILRGGLTVQNFYKRAVFDAVRFPENMRIYEDAVMNLYALLQVKKGVQGNCDGYFYRASETSSFKTRIKDLEYVRLIDELRDWYVKALPQLTEWQAAEVARDRIRGYVNGRVEEWASVLVADGQDHTLIATAAREFAKATAFTLTPGSICRGFCYGLYYRCMICWPLKICARLANLKKRIRRRLGT